MAAFHFVSGIIRNDTRLLTLSVTVVFLYGGMVWGMLPIKPDVSWEGHLWGAVSGVVLALYYRKYIIRRDKFDWEEEEEEELEGEGEVEEQKSEVNIVGEKQMNSNSTENQKNEIKWPDNMSHT
jgi:hypothetical protein